MDQPTVFLPGPYHFLVIDKLDIQIAKFSHLQHTFWYVKVIPLYLMFCSFVTEHNLKKSLNDIMSGKEKVYLFNHFRSNVDHKCFGLSCSCQHHFIG